VTGRVHSVQSLGAVDGPGLRYVVFLQGCPLRCGFCHNPDTWQFSGGTLWEAEALVKEILRYRPYFGTTGGVTFSGGEPLAQPAFTEEVFRLLKKEGIHTALDTSGAAEEGAIRQVLSYTDLILGDLKFTTPEEYKTHCGGSLPQIRKFFSIAEEMNIPLWVRHVVVPGVNDTVEDMAQILKISKSYKNFEKIEWLPFHKLCLEKYESMEIPFPFGKYPAMDQSALDALIRQLPTA
jgi:pyruvate formate lyase activating enzyme